MPPQGSQPAELPQCAEAENAVLGGILLEPERLAAIAPLLKVEDFYSDSSQVLYSAMHALHEAGEPIDRLTVQAHLERQGAFERIGGPAYLAALDLNLPDLSRLDRYAAIVQERSHRRQLIQAAEAVIRECMDGAESEHTAAVILERHAATVDRLMGESLVNAQAPGVCVNRWSAAIAAPDLLAAEGDEVAFLEPRLLAPGSLTLWFSPRGLGKTHVAHAVAVKLARAGRRVLLLDRDNSGREVRRRLRGWEGANAPSLHVMTRDKAPPLTDATAWRDFPSGQFDLVIVDSLDSTAEGVGERDSEKTSRALAVLLDIARRENGPAILVLGNTVKTAEHSRGSGVIEDRADIVYEVRDATNLNPSGTRPWVEELPEAGASAWAKRSARRQRRQCYRLAFVPTKFRLGEEPEPFILEVNLSAEPWSLRDVTDEVDCAGAQAREDREREGRRCLAAAAAALAQEVQSRAAAGPPLLKGEAEELLLRGHGLTRKAARSLIDTGSAWQLEALADRRGRPLVLLPATGSLALETTAAETAGAAKPHSSGACGEYLSAEPVEWARRESALCKSLENRGLAESPVSAADDLATVRDGWGEV